MSNSTITREINSIEDAIYNLKKNREKIIADIGLQGYLETLDFLEEQLRIESSMN
jgi:hypothetical protein